MSAIRQVRFRRVVRPMRTVFATALGSKSVLTSVLVTVATDEGAAGVGEVPTSFVFPHETPEAIGRILRQARESFTGLPIGQYPRRLADFRARFADFRMTLSGLEVALFRAALASRGDSEHAYWGGKLGRVETDITVPFIPDGELLATWLRRAVRQGFRAYKVKVSGQVDADLRFVRRVLAMLEPRVPGLVIRLDGNQGYTDRTYLAMLDRLERARINIELFEQPLRRDDHAGLKRIRGRSSVPVILDETVLDASDCRRVIDHGLGDGVNIKIAKSGIAGSAAILKLARSAGLKLMLGCMTETMVGLSAGIRLAAGTGAFDYLDLDSIHLIAHRRRYGDIAVAGREFVLDGRNA